MASESLAARRAAPAASSRLAGLLVPTLALGVLALLILGLFRTSALVTIDDDGSRFRVRTHASTVAAALDQAGTALWPEDRVWPELSSPLEPGVVVTVERAQPVVLRVDGASRSLRTQARTLGGLLVEEGLALGPGDELRLDGEIAEPTEPLPEYPGAEPQDGSAHPPVIGLRRAAEVTLNDGGVTRTLHTLASSVGQALSEQQVVLFPVDRITPGLEAPIRAGMAVTIERSIPVQIEADGRVIYTRTLASAVAGVLGQVGVSLVGRDTVEPDLDGPVRASTRIRVTRVREEFVVEFEPIPFETVWVADSGVEIDTRRLVQQGQPGLTKRRYRVRYEDDGEVERVLEDAWTDQQPVAKTWAYGTKIVVRTLETPDGPIEYWRKIRVYTTSYTAKSAGKAPDHPRFGYTRLGWKLTKGIVAVDPTVIPLKTRLYVPGYGIARAGDTGGGVKGKFVDLGFDSWNYQSWHWWTDVYLLTPAPPASQILWILPDWPRYPDRKRQ